MKKAPMLQARVRGENILLQCGLCDQLWTALENHRRAMRKAWKAVMGEKGLLYLVANDVDDERVAPAAAAMRDLREVLLASPLQGADDE